MKYSTKTLQELKENCKHQACKSCVIRSVCSDILNSIGHPEDIPQYWSDNDILIIGVPQHKKTNTYTYDNIVKALEFAMAQCRIDNEKEADCSTCMFHNLNNEPSLMCEIEYATSENPDEWDKNDITRIADSLIKKEPNDTIIDIIDYISGLRNLSQHNDTPKFNCYIPPTEYERYTVADEPQDKTYTKQEVKKVIEEMHETCQARETTFSGCQGCPYIDGCLNIHPYDEAPQHWQKGTIEYILNQYFPEPIKIPELITKTIDKQRLEEHLPF